MSKGRPFSPIRNHRGQIHDIVDLPAQLAPVITLSREEFNASVLPAKKLAQVAITALTTAQEVAVMKEFTEAATAHGWEVCGLGRHAVTPVSGPTYAELLTQVATLTAELDDLRPVNREADVLLALCDSLRARLTALKEAYRKIPKQHRRGEYLIEYARRYRAERRLQKAEAGVIPRHVRRREWMRRYQAAWLRKKRESESPEAKQRRQDYQRAYKLRWRAKQAKQRQQLAAA